MAVPSLAATRPTRNITRSCRDSLGCTVEGGGVAIAGGPEDGGGGDGGGGAGAGGFCANVGGTTNASASASTREIRMRWLVSPSPGREDPRRKSLGRKLVEVKVPYRAI